MHVTVRVHLNLLPQIIALTGGTFWMGQKEGHDEEQPIHRVTISPFGLAECQVTNGQYDHFRCETGHRRPKFQDEKFLHSQQPVVGISWFDAKAYCRWLAERTGSGIRLPTEAEWEWAARSGVGGKLYPWGNAPVTEREDYALCWRDAPECVATSDPNAFGLYGMCENVHEWCSDWYDPGYYDVSPRDNPRGPATGTRRSSRGGAWRHHIKIARCAARSSIPPELEYADYGFRVACDG